MPKDFISQPFSRRSVISGLAVAAATAAVGCSASGQSANDDGTIYFGVSGPLSGPQAEYGEYWKQGFDLALEEINGDGGIDGRKLDLKWEDSQSDPKQSVPIAQRFVSDQAIIAELGDFSSPASMAASSVYQKAGLVQFGFTNSAPAFTQGGTYMWTTALTQAYYQTLSAQLVAEVADTISVVYIQSDWGLDSYDTFKAEADKIGLKVLYESPFQPDSTDFRPILIKARDAQPDALVHIGYAPDGAQIVRQARELGWDGEIFGGQATPQFIEAGGEAVNGVKINENLLIGNDSPAVVEFNDKFNKKFGHEPSIFSVYAYDALQVLAQAAERGGASREGIFNALNDGKSFHTVQFGDFTFTKDRRPGDVPTVPLVVEDGKFVAR